MDLQIGTEARLSPLELTGGGAEYLEKSLYLFPVSISSIENISLIVKALNCPWPFVNTERRARAS